MTFSSNWFCLIIVLALGCASRRIETPQTQIPVRPANFPRIRLAQENIRFYVRNVPPQVQTGMGFNAGSAISGGISGTITSPSFVIVSGNSDDAALLHNLFAERRLYDGLFELSDRSISASAQTEFEIERIEVLGSFPDMKLGESISLALTSFFIPPVASAKTEMECPFEAGFILKKNEKVIQKQRFSVLIKGDYKGWYVARGIQAKHLMNELLEQAEREIPLKILQYLYSETLETQP